MTSPLLAALLDIAALAPEDVPDDVLGLARFSFFDWLVVARAGVGEPVGRLVSDYVREEGGVAVASVIGGGRVPSRAAALANGTISHALDYDDTHFAHVGHLSVGIMPAALAAAEETGASLGDLYVAFALGAEAACRLGIALGRWHYNRGFHQTATAGAIGATVAAGRLYGLSRTQMRNALSLVGTRASGLKSQFGTMGKPFNAGIAAANGVEAAQLARRGFLSCDDGLAGPQGFLPTHSDEPCVEAALADLPPRTFVFRDNKYKFHACCHGTHAMIEALRTALGSEPVGPDEIASVAISVNPRWLRVCDIKAPRTGLEVKFSYAWLAGMVAHGIDTSADGTYTDALAGDARLAAFAQKVTVAGDEAVADTGVAGTMQLRDGRGIGISCDIATVLPPEAIARALRHKAEALLGHVEAAAIAARLDQGSATAVADLRPILG